MCWSQACRGRLRCLFFFIFKKLHLSIFLVVARPAVWAAHVCVQEEDLQIAQNWRRRRGWDEMRGRATQPLLMFLRQDMKAFQQDSCGQAPVWYTYWMKEWHKYRREKSLQATSFMLFTILRSVTDLKPTYLLVIRNKRNDDVMAFLHVFPTGSSTSQLSHVPLTRLPVPSRRNMPTYVFLHNMAAETFGVFLWKMLRK